jgi:inner membrane protein
VCAEIPDLDVVGFWFGVPYADLFGHRGFTHSIFFAGLLATGVVRLLARSAGSTARLWMYLFLSTLSHGFCDALTDGGLGVAFFSPFDTTRYFFPFRPIVVSPLHWRDVLSPVGLHVLWSELLWIWIPCAVMAGMSWWIRGRTQALGGASGRC